MTIRKKTLIIIGITAAILIAILYITSRIILLGSVVRVEERDTSEDVERALGVLDHELAGLSILDVDWASWDDTYEYVEDPQSREDYVQSNILDSTFTGTGINLLLVVNTSNKIVLGRAFDLNAKQSVPVPQDLEEQIYSGDSFLQHPDIKTGRSGILLLPEGPLLIAAYPILTSEGEGPARGALIMGRYLDAEKIKSLAETTRLSIEVHRLDDQQMPADFLEAKNSLSVNNPILIRPPDQETIAGYALVNDIYDRSALILRVSKPREIYQQGQVSISYFVLSFLALSLVFGGLSAVLLEKLVLSRLAHLSRSVEKIGAGGDLSARVQMTGKDELVSLAQAINGMLESLERAEGALHESEERYRTLVAQAPIGIITCDRQGNVIDANPAFSAIIGPQDKNADGSFNVFSTPSLAHSGLAEDFRTCLEDNKPVVSEWPYRTQGKKEMVLRLRAVPLEDKQGEVGGLLATLEDISEQRQLETQLRQLQKMEAIGTLAGGIAHEFNNLLTGIIGNLSLAIGEVDPASEVYRDLQGVERSAKRGVSLTRQLLTLSRKQHVGKWEQANLGQVIQEVVSMLRQTIDQSIAINTNVAADLWPVEADVGQMNQALVNLCLNARDAITDFLQGKCPSLPEERPDDLPAIYIGANNVTLDEEYCSVHPDVQPGRFVRLTISDNGCGMDAKTQARAFDPFFTTKGVGQGAGLGLPVVFGIIKGHNGFINLYSEPGMGTTIRIYLPCVAGKEKVEDTEAQPTPLPRGSETILLVDDDELVRGAGQRILESCGYTVTLAKDGLEAQEIYKLVWERIALVLLDMTMPRQSGSDTLHKLLQINPEAKIILTSGYPIGEPGLTQGAAAFIQKPFDLYDLARAVRAVLEG